MNSIFAMCTGHGKAGVAVFRISGPESFQALQELTSQKISNMQPRCMYLAKIHRPSSKELIDYGMVVFFPKGASFTGEDVVELHVHGSLAVTKLLNIALTELQYLRLAKPGEFARRAFLNDKLDLTSAEGLADLLDAETEMQHKQAIRQLGGELEKIYDSWRSELLKIMALIEAYIDFPDEEIPDEVLVSSQSYIDKLISSIEEHLSDNNRGERLRSGIKLAIIGKPNAGKSSLLNQLMQREIAIVSDIAGTTRDVIEGHLDIGGYPVILQDTAGIRSHTTDQIEQIGIEKAKKTQENSDITIFIFDSRNLDTDISEFSELFNENSIIVLNKIDLLEKELSLPQQIIGHNIIKASLKQKIGQKEIIEQIKNIAEKIANPGESPAITRERHRTQLENALTALRQFSFTNDLVLAAEDLRMTVRYLSNITGTITADEVLGEIFANFCIGK